MDVQYIEDYLYIFQRTAEETLTLLASSLMSEASHRPHARSSKLKVVYVKLTYETLINLYMYLDFKITLFLNITVYNKSAPIFNITKLNLRV